MKPYARPRHDAPLDELRAAMDQLDEDIHSGDRRAVDCCEEMNRLQRLIDRAQSEEDRHARLEHAFSRPSSPETPLPEGI